MKIEIDLKDILGDEYGDMESLAESIERQVVSHIKEDMAKGIKSKIDDEVIEIISSKVKEAADKLIPSLTGELVDQEYTPVDRYGDRSEPTTMRKQLLKTLKDQMVYKKSDYDRDKTYFTKNIDALVEQQMKEFKKSFDSMVNEVFTKEAFEYALIKMKQKFKMGE